MSITWEISQLDGASSQHRALKWAASAGRATHAEKEHPDSAGQVSTCPYDTAHTEVA